MKTEVAPIIQVDCNFPQWTCRFPLYCNCGYQHQGSCRSNGGTAGLPYPLLSPPPPLPHRLYFLFSSCGGIYGDIVSSYLILMAVNSDSVGS